MDTLSLSHAPGILTVTLNRPEVRNVFNEVMIAELTAEFTQVAGLPEVRLVVLAGEGRSFCAGADLAWMQKMVDYTHAENVADAGALAAMLRVILAEEPLLHELVEHRLGLRLLLLDPSHVDLALPLELFRGEAGGEDHFLHEGEPFIEPIAQYV